MRGFFFNQYSTFIYMMALFTFNLQVKIMEVVIKSRGWFLRIFKTAIL